MKKQTIRITPAEVQEKWESLHVLLREIKKERHLTNQQIGDAINVSSDRVRKFFAGDLKNPNVFGVMALCNYLGLSLDALLGNPHGKAVAEIEAEVAHHKENAARLEAEVARLENENRILNIELEHEKENVRRTEDTLKRTDSATKRSNTSNYILIAICAVMVVALMYYLGIDIAHRNIGFVRDDYVLPMGFVVIAVLVAGFATLVAMVVGLLKENRKKGEDKDGN